MNKSRLEAFSDGVLAIIITIMVLEIKVPHGSSWDELLALTTVGVSYLLSFVFVGIYWVNHHHLLHSVKGVTPGIMWGNLGLLFCLSLVPFVTGWMGENHFAPNTVATYGVVLLTCGVAFTILQKMVERHALDVVVLRNAFSTMNKKGIASTVGYSLSIPLAYISPAISGAIFLLIACMWFIPDKNIAHALNQDSEDAPHH